MNTATQVTEIVVDDPVTGLPVHIAIYKDNATGGMFGVDSSFVSQMDLDDCVYSPFNAQPTQVD